MKRNFITGLMACALSAVVFSSCGKGDDVISYVNPADTTEAVSSPWPTYKRNSYKEGQLRAAINYDKHPHFRLACGIGSEFLDINNPATKMVLQHFDEITFGNELKFASCVKWGSTTGEMDFTRVKQMIAMAKQNNITIFGHTLAWHSQQPTAYLRTLVKSGTQQEKKERLQKAMEKWIDACMKETNGYITCWDAVNEAISGEDLDHDGWYELQGHGVTDKNNLNLEGENFYWQDYLGPENYIPFVFNTAREKFAQYGGNPDHLKLFINDYNLESDWDQNHKLKSLIHWIEIWEKGGKRCKIDGIGTQMHISVYANQVMNESKKRAITEQFKLMAATGKLCKISEFDIGYKRLGNEAWDKPAVQYDQLTATEAKQMADLYEYVISEYFRIIPPEQQFGITQWCLADSPKNSGWRKGEPAGLWKLNFTDTWPMFDGFMKGLVNSAN